MPRCSCHQPGQLYLPAAAAKLPQLQPAGQAKAAAATRHPPPACRGSSAWQMQAQCGRAPALVQAQALAGMQAAPTTRATAAPGQPRCCAPCCPACCCCAMLLLRLRCRQAGSRRTVIVQVCAARTSTSCCGRTARQPRSPPLDVSTSSTWHGWGDSCAAEVGLPIAPSSRQHQRMHQNQQAGAGLTQQRASGR
jgi:hypothetical protein